MTRPGALPPRGLGRWLDRTLGRAHMSTCGALHGNDSHPKVTTLALQLEARIIDEQRGSPPTLPDGTAHQKPKDAPLCGVFHAGVVHSLLDRSAQEQERSDLVDHGHA